MPFCRKCGNKIDDEDRFCARCGNSVERALNVSENKGFKQVETNTSIGKSIRQPAEITEQVYQMPVDTQTNKTKAGLIVALVALSTFLLLLIIGGAVFLFAYKDEGVSFDKLNGNETDSADYSKDTFDYNDLSIQIFTATFDYTDPFADALDLDSNFVGTIEGEFELTLEDGEYELAFDKDKFLTNCESFIYNNIDTILENAFDTSDKDLLAEYATYLGYSDYDDMKEGMVKELMSSFDTDDLDTLSDSGNYTTVGNTIYFDSLYQNDFSGNVVNGSITVNMEEIDNSFSGNDKLVFTQ